MFLRVFSLLYHKCSLEHYLMSCLSLMYSVFKVQMVEMRGVEPLTPCLQGKCSPNWATPPYFTKKYFFSKILLSCLKYLLIFENFNELSKSNSRQFSLERRWSSRTFRYGYLVTTSPQLSMPPSTTSSLRLDNRLRVFPTPMVWRAVCTRPGNAFTAAFWSAITSNSSFM